MQSLRTVTSVTSGVSPEEIIVAAARQALLP
jgi:hypothetical protein